MDVNPGDKKIEQIKRMAKGLRNDLDNNRISRSSYDLLIGSFNRDLEKMGSSERVE